MHYAPRTFAELVERSSNPEFMDQYKSRVDAYYVSKFAKQQRRYGVSGEALESLRLNGALSAYKSQRSQARTRGIDFRLTLGEWWAIWNESGHYSERGIGANRYCMSRRGDIGAYAIGNVYIQTCAENTSEFRQRFIASGRKNKPSVGGKSALGGGRGWTLRKKPSSKPYVVQVAGTKQTAHATQAEAEAEYKRRCAEVMAARLADEAGSAWHAQLSRQNNPPA